MGSTAPLLHFHFSLLEAACPQGSPEEVGRNVGQIQIAICCLSIPSRSNIWNHNTLCCSHVYVYVCAYTYTHPFNFKNWLTLQTSPANRGYYPGVPFFPFIPWKEEMWQNCGSQGSPELSWTLSPLLEGGPSLSAAWGGRASTGHPVGWGGMGGRT